MWTILRALLFLLPAESAHRLTALLLRTLSQWLPLKLPPEKEPIQLWGQRYRNRFGLAAGFDKGEVLGNALFRLGFGFIEIGTVTPRPQSGNPRPRLFRLPSDRALVNRMGFNNPGASRVAERLQRWTHRAGPVWANIGKNKDTSTDQAAEDYAQAARILQPFVDALVVNVSSPNTPGLRDLQAEAALQPILLRVVAEAKGKPVLVKLSPDLADAALPGIVRLAREVGLVGIVATNTTVARPVATKEAGGLSGEPLGPRATAVLKILRELAGNDLVLVGTGGVMNGGDFAARRAAGADFVEAYSGFVYGGPCWVRQVLFRHLP